MTRQAIMLIAAAIAMRGLWGMIVHIAYDFMDAEEKAGLEPWEYY